MVVHIGNTAIADMYYGSTKIAEAYLGNTLVYQSTPKTNYIFRDLDTAGNLTLATGTLENADKITIIDTDNVFYNAFFRCIGLTGSVTFNNLTTITGKNACRAMFDYCSSITAISFPELTTINGECACNFMFDSCGGLTSVTFPKLTTINGGNACAEMFQSCENLESASFPELTTISGYSDCCYMLNNCRKLSSVSFPKLAFITGQKACERMFGYNKLESLSFPSLTTNSFGSYTNQFKDMMVNTVTATNVCTIHFPSNLVSTISALEGYPLFGGNTGCVVLAFDLPATS